MLPRRPLLAPDLRARGYERRRGRLVLIASPTADDPYGVDSRGWTILEACDGTRDVAGIARAARLAGISVTVDEVTAFVAQVAEAGIVVDGADERAPAPAPTETAVAITTPPDTVVETMPFDLRCDGSGSCCRLYFSVTFTQAEAARARAHVPGVLHAGSDERRAFYPDAGLDRAGLSVCLDRGACAYLGNDRRCRIHAAAGEHAKPTGCRLYPDLFVDDGERVRASPVLECACVFLSAKHPPIAYPDRRRRDLDGHAVVEHVPDMIALSTVDAAPRAAVVRAFDDLAATLSPEVDAARALVAMSLACQRGDAPASLPILAQTPAPDEEAVIARAVLELRARVAIAERQAAFRDDDDLVKIALGALATAGDLIEDDPFGTPATDATAEAFYLRVSFWGRHFLRPSHEPVDARFARAAAHVLLARGLGFVASRAQLSDPAFGQPLALVEALGRTYVA